MLRMTLFCVVLGLHALWGVAEDFCMLSNVSGIPTLALRSSTGEPRILNGHKGGYSADIIAAPDQVKLGPELGLDDELPGIGSAHGVSACRRGFFPLRGGSPPPLGTFMPGGMGSASGAPAHWADKPSEQRPNLLSCDKIFHMGAGHRLGDAAVSIALVLGVTYSRRKIMMMFLWVVLFAPGVVAVCPGCFGNNAGCTYNTDGKCATLDDPRANAAVVAGVASVMTALGATALTLTNLISPRFLRMFTRAHLTTIMQLVKRPSPGTIFELTKDTKLSAILHAVGAGQLTMEQAAVSFAGFIDDATDDTEIAKLTAKYKLITSTKELKGLGAGDMPAADAGVFSWLFGKITHFVADRGMQVHIDVSSAASSSSTLTTTIIRTKDSTDFFEALNLFIMFTVALGLCTAVPMTEFLEFVVFDTIRMRGYPWQFAHELFVVMLRRIEDSGGTLTFKNCINDSHLNTVMDEAMESGKQHYKDDAFFRTSGWEPRRGGAAPKGDDTKYNGKWTATAKQPCLAFNTGGVHTGASLLPDGTCKFLHKCDKHVTNKGPNGKCMGTEGTPGHTRATCDNPHRCDAPVRA